MGAKVWVLVSYPSLSVGPVRRRLLLASHLAVDCTALVSPARRSAVNCGHLPPHRRRGRQGPLPLEERKADDAEDGVVVAPISLDREESDMRN